MSARCAADNMPMDAKNEKKTRAQRLGEETAAEFLRDRPDEGEIIRSDTLGSYTGLAERKTPVGKPYDADTGGERLFPTYYPSMNIGLQSPPSALLPDQDADDL